MYKLALVLLWLFSASVNAAIVSSAKAGAGIWQTSAGPERAKGAIFGIDSSYSSKQWFVGLGLQQGQFESSTQLDVLSQELQLSAGYRLNSFVAAFLGSKIGELRGIWHDGQTRYDYTEQPKALGVGLMGSYPLPFGLVGSLASSVCYAHTVFNVESKSNAASGKCFALESSLQFQLVKDLAAAINIRWDRADFQNAESQWDNESLVGMFRLKYLW